MAGKIRLLCLHGFRTSAAILQQQVQLAQWGQRLLDLVDLTFLDAPWPATGQSDVEEKFSPPYFEWYHSNDDFTEFVGIEGSISFLLDFIRLHGPFDGLIGFSQGAMMAAALMGFQQKGTYSSGTVPIQLLISIGGGIPSSPLLRAAFTEVIRCPSLHFLGKKDFMRERGQQLALCFENPVVINHPRGHVVPKLDAAAEYTFIDFLATAKAAPLRLKS